MKVYCVMRSGVLLAGQVVKFRTNFELILPQNKAPTSPETMLPTQINENDQEGEKNRNFVVDENVQRKSTGEKV